MGGNVDTKPCAVSWENGKVDVYGTGPDGCLVGVGLGWGDTLTALVRRQPCKKLEVHID